MPSINSTKSTRSSEPVHIGLTKFIFQSKIIWNSWPLRFASPSQKGKMKENAPRLLLLLPQHLHSKLDSLPKMLRLRKSSVLLALVDTDIYWKHIQNVYISLFHSQNPNELPGRSEEDVLVCKYRHTTNYKFLINIYYKFKSSVFIRVSIKSIWKNCCLLTSIGWYIIKFKETLCKLELCFSYFCNKGIWKS